MNSPPYMLKDAPAGLRRDRLSVPGPPENGAGGTRSVLVMKLDSAVTWTAQLGQQVRWAGLQRGE